MLAVLLSLAGVLFIGLFVILINSPGKLPPLKDEQGNIIQGSISEKVWVNIKSTSSLVSVKKKYTSWGTHGEFIYIGNIHQICNPVLYRSRGL